MNREDEIQLILEKARNELYEIEAKKKFERNAPFVGRCFKFRNSYSTTDENEKWWLYEKILGLDNTRDFITFKFETDINGKITIEPTDCGYIYDRHIEISQEEFDDAWKNLVEKISHLMK